MDDQIMQTEIVLSTLSSEVVDEIRGLSGVAVNVQRNITGETILLLTLSPAVLVATIKVLERLLQSRLGSKDVVVKSQSIKFGNGSVEIKGFSLTESLAIIDKLSTVKAPASKPKS